MFLQALTRCLSRMGSEAFVRGSVFRIANRARGPLVV
jgi:hypothetical protein